MRKIYWSKQSFKWDYFIHFYKKISAQKEQHILLESGRDGKYSMFGVNAMAILEGWDNYLLITDYQGNREKIEGDPLEVMKQWMSRYQMPFDEELPDFQGGAMGFVSYDYARKIEKLPSLAKDDLETPLLYFLVFDEFAVYDHEKQALWLVKIGKQDDEKKCRDWIEEMESICQSINSSVMKDTLTYEKAVPNDELEVSLTDYEFQDAVRKIKQYIAQGDLFQVNLSVRQSKPLIAKPLDIYLALRKLNPSPYMSYMHTSHFQIVSGSPELLVKKKGDMVSTRPIAGTRSRGANEQEDERLANELIENEKERAEHVMLVDLERNDLGRVCRYGSVQVNEFMVIEKYSHVMHIVSNVQGLLAEGNDGYDVIRAVFPGGTITGAPKVRTMEVIEELEPVRRGIYTGSIGWIGFNGDMELNIVIRTLLAKDGVGHIQAGAGIVIDSEPKHEYKESLKKAAAVWRAKELADQAVLSRGEQR